MSGISELRNSVVDYLQRDHRLGEFIVTGDYPGVRRDNPLRTATIAIGLDSFHIDESMGGYLGGSDDGDSYGAICDITLRIDIFVPALREANPYEALEIVLDRLFVAGNEFGFYKLWSEGVKWDSTAGALKLAAKGSLRAVLGTLDDSVAAEGFEIRATNLIEKE